ncbi:MAG: hypothetical protein QXT81_00630 [Candidatus Bathyarchaeia archaeon]
MEIDSLIANVRDIETALRELASRIGLRPFLRFDLTEAQTSIPAALLNVGKVSLELLGHVEGERLESGVLSSVEIDGPELDEIPFSPAPEMNIVCHPAETPRVRSVQIMSLRPLEDERLLLEQLGAVSTETKGRVKLGSLRKPFRVMPGLSESMVTLPSGAILQLTQQELKDDAYAGC